MCSCLNYDYSHYICIVLSLATSLNPKTFLSWVPPCFSWVVSRSLLTDSFLPLLGPEWGQFLWP